MAKLFEDLLSVMLEKHPDCYEFLDANYHNDRQIALQVCKRSPAMFRHCGKILRGDKDLALIVCRRDGLALTLCSDELIVDEDVVLAACNNNPEAARFIGKDFLVDHERLRKAWRCVSMRNLSLSARNHDKVILSCYRAGILDCHALSQEAQEKFRSCFTRIADGFTVEDALVQMFNGDEILHRPEGNMRCDPPSSTQIEILQAMLSEFPLCFGLLRLPCRENVKLVKTACKRAPEVATYFPPRYLRDRDLAETFCQHNGRLLLRCPKELTSDPDVVSAACSNYPYAALFLSEDFLADLAKPWKVRHCVSMDMTSCAARCNRDVLLSFFRAKIFSHKALTLKALDSWVESMGRVDDVEDAQFMEWLDANFPKDAAART